MIKTIRINIPYSETRNMEDVLTECLNKANITIDQIRINLNNKYSSQSHFGNWCFVPALDIPELHTIKQDGFFLDLPGFFLEKSDIESLKIGDKVKIQSRNFLAGISINEGKVYDIDLSGDKSSITILKKGTKTGKGWHFYEDEEVMLEKI
jgi:hypothetical protein